MSMFELIPKLKPINMYNHDQTPAHVYNVVMVLQVIPNPWPTGFPFHDVFH